MGATGHRRGVAEVEASRAEAPPVEALANEATWRLGMLRVNRNGASVLVESPPGVGYALSLGNHRPAAPSSTSDNGGSRSRVGHWRKRGRSRWSLFVKEDKQ